jgi:hypothetical protein
MRTKSMILAAAAVLGGFLSAQAQNVYSLNIVGYVNTVIKGNGAYTLLANPLNAPTNDMQSLLPLATLPNKSQVLVWDTTSSGYLTAQKTLGNWNANLPLPVGTGFFVKNTSAADITNTFVGEVVGGSPGTNTTQIVPGYQLIGSKSPIGGNLFATGDNTLNMGALLLGLPNKSQVITWDNTVPPGGFLTVQKTLGNWASTNVQINVGQGFFIRSAAATTNVWTQVLQ